VTIAKDVKIQVEFNPARVAAYRLVGYENRRLADRDFNDDRKDAGEIGAGHTVTALYEVIPPGASENTAPPLLDELKYQSPTASKQAVAGAELLTVKLRYQLPGGGPSTKLAVAVNDPGHRFEDASADFRFAAAVACFGMTLRGSRHGGGAGYAEILRIAAAALGGDESGSRAEFVDLVKQAARLAGQEVAGWQNARPAATRWAPMPGWPAVSLPIPGGPSGTAPWLALGCGLVLGVMVASVATGICLMILLRPAGPSAALGGGAKLAGKEQGPSLRWMRASP
jgi:hypothetical protein